MHMLTYAGYAHIEPTRLTHEVHPTVYRVYVIVIEGTAQCTTTHATGIYGSTTGYPAIVLSKGHTICYVHNTFSCIIIITPQTLSVKYFLEAKAKATKAKAKAKKVLKETKERR